MPKAQATLERSIIIAISLFVTIMVIALVSYFFFGLNLNSSFSISAMKITNFGPGTISFILFSNTKMVNPNSVNVYINSIQNGFNTTHMTYNVSYSDGKYLYAYNGKISQSIESMLSNATNPTLIISEINQNKKTIFSTTNILLKTMSYSPLLNKITFYIFPPTTDFGISISNYTSLVQNGQTLYLPNGKFKIKAVQTNPNSKLYFDFWNTTTYSGNISIIGGYKSSTTTLYLDNSSGAVSLFLNGYMNITFTSNNNSLINLQTNYTCGNSNTRFCFDGSVRNLYYVYGENSSSFGFNYPPYVGNSSNGERYGFVGYLNNAYSCPISNKNSPTEINQSYQTSCVVNATYAKEYYMLARSSNSTRGLVSILFFNGTQAPYSSSVDGYAEKGSTNEFLAKSPIDYSFVNWTGTYQSISDPYSLVVTKSVNETANFKVTPPNITFEANYSGATVSVSVNSNSIGTESVPYTYTFNNFTDTYTVNWNWTHDVNGHNFSSQSFGCEKPSSSTSSASGTYSFDNTCQNYIVKAKYTSPPQTSYYIYGCIINSSNGDCVQSLNGSVFSISVGNYNTSIIANQSTPESSYPFPSAGYVGSQENSFNVATKLTDGSDILQLQEITDVGYCKYAVNCSNPYTQWIPYSGGSSRVAEYTCSGTSCPAGSGNDTINKTTAISYSFIFENVNCTYVSGVSVESCDNGLVSGSSNVSLSPKKYSATYINSNHPSLNPPPTSTVSYSEYYPYSSSYEYQFVKSAQKIFYAYPEESGEGYAYCWMNSTENSTTMPITSVYVPSNYETSGGLCQSSGIDLAIQNITSYSYYTLINKISTITVDNYPGNVNGDYLSLSVNSGTLSKISTQELKDGDGVVNETGYEIGTSPSINSYTLTIRHASSSQYNYLLLVKNETTGTTVPISGASQVGSYYNITTQNEQLSLTLNSSDSYEIYAIYFMPINVQTDLLSSQMNFSTFFGYSTTPYNTNLLGFNKNSVGENTTYYALPPSIEYMPNYNGYEYSITEGMWDGNSFNQAQGINNPISCFQSDGEVHYCFSTTDSGSGISGNATYGTNRITKTNTATSFYYTWQSHYSLSENYLTARGSYDSASVQPGTYTQLPDLNITYQVELFNMTNIGFYSPSTINLNYGYTIPIFISYNDNMSYEFGTAGNCNNFGEQTFSTIEGYLYNMSNEQYTCYNSLKKESPSSIIYTFIVSNPSQNITITLPSIKQEYNLQSLFTPYKVTYAYDNLTGFMETNAQQYNQLYYMYESDSGYQPISNGYSIEIFNYKIPTSPNDQNAYGFYSSIS